MKNQFVPLAVFLFAVLALSVSSLAASDLEAELDKATSRATREKHVLRYKLKKGERVSYEVEQLATVDTTIAGNNQQTKLRSKSQRSFLVTGTSRNGDFQFQHIIDSVDMWSEVSGNKAVRYNSKTDKEVPVEFQNVADMIGTPISEITMNSLGKIVKRTDKVKQQNLGMGGLSIPLPEAAIAIGHKWSKPQNVKVRLRDQRIKTIKTRELYELKKVEAGVATISIRTQILTPINDAKIKSQLVQRVSTGEIKFDVDAGRLISKQLDWDENVLGFNGPDSNMKYLARFTERLQTSTTTTATRKKTTAK